MARAHFSFVVCGSDDFTWVGYGLADRSLGDDDDDGEDDDDNADEYHDGKEEHDGGDMPGLGTVKFEEDPILMGKVDSSTIECPREYFARALEIRATQNLEELSDVVAILEDNTVRKQQNLEVEIY